jgi:formamidopyrimidine-DNA glycosylase
MSVELPEAYVVAEQMNRELRQKQIRSYQLQNHERLQKLGFMNKDAKTFDQIVKGKIDSVESRGNVILLKLDNRTSLILGPEYGGRIQYHKTADKVADFHLKLDFTDGSALTVRLTGMGVIQVMKDSELDRSYVYRRDFLGKGLSPSDEKNFTFERFGRLLSNNGNMMKTVLVGKDAVVVGLGNAAFQDIVFRAKLHPKRKASSLTTQETRSLYDSIKLLIQERIRLGGKEQFADLYGKQGQYKAAMGPNFKDKTCPRCGSRIEKLSLGGGITYFCPKCQT